MKPEELIDAALAGLILGEAICIPAMEDTELLTEIHESQKRFFEQTRSGKVAERYRA
jgi:hypothetical protein